MIRATAVLGLCGLLAACAAEPPPAPLPPPPPLPLPAPPSPPPDTVTGLSAAALRAAFGAPALVRKDGVAEMWRYDGAPCHAFFFLYDDQGVKVVRRVETLPQGQNTQTTGEVADSACLKALRVSGF